MIRVSWSLAQAEQPQDFRPERVPEPAPRQELRIVQKSNCGCHCTHSPFIDILEEHLRHV